MTKVCHMISGHDTNDIRVFQKECTALSKNGYDVILLCSDAKGDREVNGVKITSIAKCPQSRLNRFVFSTRQFYKKAKQIDAEIYHIHEPFLLGVGKKLKKRGKKVIFDSHEDYPCFLLEKEYIPKFLRKFISRHYEKKEKKILCRFDAVIGVTPKLVERLSKFQSNTILVTNYPILISNIPDPQLDKKQAVFAGQIERSWRVDNVIKAIGDIDGATFEIRTRSFDASYYDNLKNLPGWEKVNFAENATHDEVMQLLSKSYCGVAIIDYCQNMGGKDGTLGCNKLFEYMMAGIPVLCTDFKLWKNIIDEYQCGICVDPNDIDAIRNGLVFLFNNKEAAKQMGLNGRKAVFEKYNWNVEERKLLSLYNNLV